MAGNVQPRTKITRGNRMVKDTHGALSPLPVFD
jgi:hypothetical protein